MNIPIPSTIHSGFCAVQYRVKRRGHFPFASLDFRRNANSTKRWRKGNRKREEADHRREGEGLVRRGEEEGGIEMRRLNPPPIRSRLLPPSINSQSSTITLPTTVRPLPHPNGGIVTISNWVVQMIRTMERKRERIAFPSPCGYVTAISHLSLKRGRSEIDAATAIGFRSLRSP